MQIQTGGAAATVNSDNSNSGSDNGSGDNSNTGNNNNSNSNQQDQPASQPEQGASQPTQTASQQAEPATEQPEDNNQKTKENTPALALADEGEETPEDTGAESKPVDDGSSSDTNAVGSQTPEMNAAENTQYGDTAKTEATNQATSGQNTGAMENDCTGDGETNGSLIVNRDEQSATVETKPGTGGIGDSTADAEEKTDDSSKETETTTPEDKTEKNDDEEKETENKNSVSGSLLFNRETGHIQVTFNIDADAQGDQTIELSDVNRLLREKGNEILEEKLDENSQYYDSKIKAEYDAAIEKLRNGDEIASIEYSDEQFGLHYAVDYTLETDENGNEVIKCVGTNLYYEPGCATVFDISLTSDSKHTYKYYTESFTVNTPDISGETEVYVGEDGELTEEKTSKTLEKGTEIEKICGYYYVKSGDYYYGKLDLDETQVIESKDGKLCLAEDVADVSTQVVYDTNKVNGGFDGQVLPERYTQNQSITLKYDKVSESGCIEDLVDTALYRYGAKELANQYVDEETGKLTTEKKTVDVPADTEVELIGDYYYIKSESSAYYYRISKDKCQTKVTENGKVVLAEEVKDVSTIAYKGSSSVTSSGLSGKYVNSDGELISTSVQIPEGTEVVCLSDGNYYVHAGEQYYIRVDAKDTKTDAEGKITISSTVSKNATPYYTEQKVTASPIENAEDYYLNEEGELKSAKATVTAGTAVKEINGKYYVERSYYDAAKKITYIYYYGGFSADKVNTTEDGKTVLKQDTEASTKLYKKSAKKMDSTDYYLCDGNVQSKKITFPQGKEVVKIGTKYYAKVGEYYVCTDLAEGGVTEDPDTGKLTVKREEGTTATAKAYVRQENTQVVGKAGSYVNLEGDLGSSQITVPAGTEVFKLSGYYYAKIGDYYVKLTNPLTKTEDGKTVLTKDLKTSASIYKKSDPKAQTVSVKPTRQSAGTGTIQDAVDKFMQYQGYESYDAYILDYYYRKGIGKENQDGELVKYDSVNELVKNCSEALADLYKSGVELKYTGSGETAVIKLDPNTLYNNYYQNIMSLKIGNSKIGNNTVDGYADIDQAITDSSDHEHSSDKDSGDFHGEWATDNNSFETIGAYMEGKLNYNGDTEQSINECMVAALNAASTEESNAWEKANTYFNELLKEGLSSDEATWRAFAMAINIDHYRAGNDYQDTAWMWYASLKLHQTDGTLDITKRDTNGNIIGDDAGESQTSFYIWRTIGDDGVALVTPQYCVYQGPTTKVTYKKDADGNDTDEIESTEEVAGYYYWKDYSTDDTDTYTVTTTNGNLKIDYLFLENMVYYLQEAVAPNGFQKDTNVYVICNGKQYTNLLKEAAKDANSGITTDAEGNVYYIANVAAGTSGAAQYLGEIKGGYTLKVEFVNPGIPSVPDVPNIPNVPDTPRSENPDTPTTPDTPGTTTVVQTVLGAERPVETVTPVETSSTPAVLGATRGRGTGDESNMAGWGAASLAALGALAAYFARKRRSRG